MKARGGPRRATRIAACVLALGTVTAPAAAAERARLLPRPEGEPPLIELKLSSDLELPVVKDLSPVLGLVGLPGAAKPPAQEGLPAAPAAQPTAAEWASPRVAPRRLDPLTVMRRPKATARTDPGRRDAVGKRPAFGGAPGAPPPKIRSGAGGSGPPAAPARAPQATERRAQPSRSASVSGLLPGFPDSTSEWSRAVTAGLLMGLALGLRALFAGARARRLEAQRNSLLTDVDLLQHALVPNLPERLGQVRISAAYCPAEGPGAGGDFYDAFDLGDGRVGLVVGDVAGHGRHALERATLARYRVRAYVEAGLGPRAALGLAGRVMGDDPDAGHVTVAVAELDTSAGLLTYSLAGHHPPIVLGAGVREPVSVCSSPPVGLGLPTGLRQTTISFADDAVACFFTDGLIEARVGDAMLGRESLERLLVMLGPKRDARALLSQAAGEATDDRAVCIVQLHDGPGQVAKPERELFHLEELELDESSSNAERERFLKACGVPPGEAADAVAAAESVPSGSVLRVWVGVRGAVVKVASSAPDAAGRVR